MSNSAQDIGKVRPPRVHIYYDNERKSQKQIELPFITGVLADLSGESEKEREDIEKREWLELTSRNFNKTMQTAAPRVTFEVKNTLEGGDTKLPIDLTFNSLDDFSPAAIARADESLRQLLEVREQLATLRSYMQGRSGAQKMLDDILKNPTLLAALAAAGVGVSGAGANAPAAGE